MAMTATETAQRAEGSRDFVGMPTGASSPPALDRSAVTFDGDGAAFFRLAIKGSLLQLPTFGFYRFWLINDIRRHLWGHTRLGLDRLEYLGTANELLIGFLFALAIILPLNVLIFGASLGLEFIHPALSFLGGLGILIFSQYALYRARRYRLSRTVFRGVRFGMNGSGFSYLVRATLWSLLTILTLGLAYPWQATALERYKMRHTFFGNLEGRFDGAAWILFKRGIGLWLIVAAVITAVIAVPLIVLGAEDAKKPFGLWILALLVLIPLGVLTTICAWSLLRAIRMRWGIEGIRFGEVAFSSSLSKGTYLKAYFKLFLAVIAFGVVAALLFGATYAILFKVLGLPVEIPSTRKFLHLSSMQQIAVALKVVLGYLFFGLGIGALKRRLVDWQVWKEISRTTTIANLVVLDAVIADAGPVAGSLGEGLADALDLGAF